MPAGSRANVQSQARLTIYSDMPSATVIDFGEFTGERWADAFTPSATDNEET